MSFQDILVDVIDTNATKKPNSPQFKFTNPLKKNIFINSIQLSFDSYFSEKGSILIKINDNVILNKIAGSFKRMHNFTVPMKNQEFLKQKKIEIYVWNGIDSNFVSVGYDIQISEDPNAPVSNNSPLSEIQRNNSISDSLEIFEFRTYLNEIQTQLIDMKGYKKMIVTIASSSIPAINTIQKPITGDRNLVDGTFQISQTPQSTSMSVIGLTETDSYDQILILDFSSSALRSISVDVNKNTKTVIASRIWNDAGTDPQSDGNVGNVTNVNQDKTQTYDIFESDDPDFLVGVTTIETGVSDVSQPISTTKRYLKIVEHVSISFSTSFTAGTFENDSGGIQTSSSFSLQHQYKFTDFTNWSDSLATGGQADLSFEIKGSNGQWFEFISSAEFGTIGIGNSVVRQIGDVVSRSSADKVGFVLPSTQTDFRAKLTVTIAGIQTGVSILRVQ